MSGNSIAQTFQSIFRRASTHQLQRRDDEQQPQGESSQTSSAAEVPQSSQAPSSSNMSDSDHDMDVDAPSHLHRRRPSYIDDMIMPPLQDVSDSDESGDDDFSATGSDMDADALDARLQAFRDRRLHRNGHSVPSSDAPSGVASPSRGSRRARHEQDEDQDRDRRHPSQRTGPDNNGVPEGAPDAQNSAPQNSTAAAPPVVPPTTGPRQGPHIHLLGLTIDFPSGQIRTTPGPGNANTNAPSGMPFGFADGMSVDDLFMRLGGMMGGLGVPEREDPERAKRLVNALEEVPIGLVRRMERVGAAGGSDDNGAIGDSGCAICWDKLLDGDGNQFGDDDREMASDIPPVSSDQASAPSAPVEALADGHEQPRVVALPCSHVFHASCLIPWFSRPRQTTCPTCRFNVDPDNLTYTRRRRQPVPPAPPADRQNGDAANQPAPAPAADLGTGPAQPQAPAAGANEQPRVRLDMPPDFGRVLFEQFLRTIGDNNSPRDGAQAAAPNPPPTNAPPPVPSTVNPDPIDGAAVPPAPSDIPSDRERHHVQPDGEPGGPGQMIIDMVSMVVGGMPPGQHDPAPAPPTPATSASDNPVQQHGTQVPTPSSADANTAATSVDAPALNPAAEGPGTRPRVRVQRQGEDQFMTVGFNMTFGLGPLDGEGQAQAQSPAGHTQPGPTMGELFAGMFGPAGHIPQPAPPGHADAAAATPAPSEPGAHADGQTQAQAPSHNAAPNESHATNIPSPFAFHLPPFQPQATAAAPPPATHEAGPTGNNAGPQLPPFAHFLHTAGFPPMTGAVPTMPNFPAAMRSAEPDRSSSTARRERKKWSLPLPPGPTLRQRIEKKEREAGLRCDEVSCGVGPSDEAPMIEVMEKKIRVFKTGEEGSICTHSFHPSCLVTSGRVALKGLEETVTGDKVEVACPVCRSDGVISKADWDAGASI